MPTVTDHRASEQPAPPACTRFVRRMHDLRPAELRRVADRLVGQHASAEGELAWWRATVAVGAALRAGRRSRAGSVAAHRASAAVLAGAAAAGLTAADHDVTAVARAAGEVARLLVAGGSPAVGAERCQPLLAAFAGLGVDADLALAC
jgi:hypothetical protein